MKNEGRQEDSTRESDSEAIWVVRARGKMRELVEGTESSLQICGQKGGKRSGGQKQGLSCSREWWHQGLGERKRGGWRGQLLLPAVNFRVFLFVWLKSAVVAACVYHTGNNGAHQKQRTQIDCLYIQLSMWWETKRILTGKRLRINLLWIHKCTL